MSIDAHTRFAVTTKVLFLFGFLGQFVGVLYTARGIEAPEFFGGLYTVAFTWLIWWWLREDSRRTRVTWPLDLGMFLYLAWFLIVPYHLLKTRGARGLLGILAFIGVVFAAWLFAVALAIIVWG